MSTYLEVISHKHIEKHPQRNSVLSDHLYFSPFTDTSVGVFGLRDIRLDNMFDLSTRVLVWREQFQANLGFFLSNELYLMEAAWGAMNSRQETLGPLEQLRASQSGVEASSAIPLDHRLARMGFDRFVGSFGVEYKTLQVLETINLSSGWHFTDLFPVPTGLQDPQTIRTSYAFRGMSPPIVFPDVNKAKGLGYEPLLRSLLVAFADALSGLEIDTQHEIPGSESRVSPIAPKVVSFQELLWLVEQGTQQPRHVLDGYPYKTRVPTYPEILKGLLVAAEKNFAVRLWDVLNTSRDLVTMFVADFIGEVPSVHGSTLTNMMDILIPHSWAAQAVLFMRDNYLEPAAKALRVASKRRDSSQYSSYV